jgi:anaerobic dimethyl sulfoxide reductase subunit B (iron-sulfur subunit)
VAQYGFHVNIDNCIACRACEGACKQEFELPVGIRRRRVVTEEGQTAGRPWKRHVSLACHHCADPACLRACPVKRYWKDADPAAYAQPGTDVAALRAFFGFAGPYTGLVLYKPSVAESATLGVDCVGCKHCLAACPYGAPQWDEASARMDKCTACYHRWANVPANSTLPAARRKPACVVSCTALALSFGDVSELGATKVAGDWASAKVGDPLTTRTWSGAPPAAARDIADPGMTVPSIRFTPQKNIP